jgi:lysozyme
MRIGQRGLAIVKKWEGLRLAPYKDAAGLWTIGYGHLIKEGEVFTRINGEEAEELLQHDLILAERGVEKLAESAKPSEFDAMVAFAFNVGLGRLEASTLLKLHNAGERIAAALQFPVWHLITDPKTKVKKPARGLLRRRLDEAALYLEDA